MDRFLFIFGIIVFFLSFIFFVMNFISDYESTTMVGSVLVMLNASIAICVSEILTRTKNLNNIQSVQLDCNFWSIGDGSRAFFEVRRKQRTVPSFPRGICVDIAVYLTLTFSLIVSTSFSIWTFSQNASKRLGVLIGLLINTLLLSIATIVFHKIFNVKEVEGLFSSLGILVFAFFIPIITFINFYILELIKGKYVTSKN